MQDECASQDVLKVFSVLGAGYFHMEGISVKVSGLALARLNQVACDDVHDTHFHIADFHLVVAHEAQVIQDLDQFHILWGPGSADLYQSDSLVVKRRCECPGLGVGNDILRVLSKGLWQINFPGSGKRRNPYKLALFVNDT